MKALRDGDFRRRLVVADGGIAAELASVFNEIAERNQNLAGEVARVRRAVGQEGQLSERVDASGVADGWSPVVASMNGLIEDLLRPTTELGRVLTAVARGDLSQRMPSGPLGSPRGEIGGIGTTVNHLLDQLSLFADEVTRVSREVGTDGRLGGQAEVPGVAGTWRDLTNSVNFMANNLTSQVRNIAQVATAVARGDLSQKIHVDARGEILELKTTINTMVDQLSAFADEVTRVSREVGTDGRLGGQALVPGVGGTWKDLTDNVNVMANNLTSQVRNIATVATAVARGDLSQKITVETKGEVGALAETINRMVETLRSFADEVTRVSREVGTDGVLGGQARVPNVAGTWKDLTDNVNVMAQNLTSQVRNIAQVTTAVAKGDLSKKIDVDARGEILELKTTINTMVGRLSAFASEVTRVAREVGTDGRLGGQAEVEGVSGTWQRLTESVNGLAGNLTTQVRAIAAVATAVAQGDLSQKITVHAAGEVAQLKDNVNRMINNLEVTTNAYHEQDWLKTSLARISGLMQGHRDLATVTSLVLRELAPLVNAQQGTFFLARGAEHDLVLERTASYGLSDGYGAVERFQLGESLVGQAAVDKRTILVDSAPPGYVTISSGLGSSAPSTVIVLPVLFEDRVLGVIELASVNQFSDMQRDLLEQLKKSMGVNVNTLMANSRTEALLIESQRLTQELRSRSEQLQTQQEELQRSNKELAEKAALLATQNRDIETKNTQIEFARQELEQRARQLTAASAYKSEFMANMSHELRTPLNSSLLLAKLLGDNVEGNLTAGQVEYAQAIHSAGSDLLQLINDVLDLSKVESGHMEVQPASVSVEEVVSYVESLCRPLVAEKGLSFSVDVAPSVPARLETDEHRLQQILRNLLSNAVKFTDEGSVRLHIRLGEPPESRCGFARRDIPRVAFDVEDSGIGIPEDKLEVIFDAFQQADGTTNRKYGGTGLGLTISREAASLIGADLHVRSMVGSGSSFILYVPVRWIASPAVCVPVNQPVQMVAEHSDLAEGRVDHEPAETESTSSADTALQTFDLRFHGEKVLIVDDDPRTVFALTTLLERYGLRVACGENGMAGLQKLTQEKDIALILMDVMMPVLDGHATTQKIRQRPEYADLPIIALTAKAMKGDDAKSLAAGATSYVTKPVDIDHLLHEIATCLDSRGARQR